MRTKRNGLLALFSIMMGMSVNDGLPCLIGEKYSFILSIITTIGFLIYFIVIPEMKLSDNKESTANGKE